MKKAIVPLIFLFLLFVLIKLLINPLSGLLDKNDIENALIYKNSNDLNRFIPGDILFRSPVTDAEIEQKRLFGFDMSRVGVVVNDNGELAVMSVKDSVAVYELNEWLDIMVGMNFECKRYVEVDSVLMNSVFSVENDVLKKYLGKKRDYNYSWQDNSYYQTELIWKLYEREVGVELTNLDTLHNVVKGGKATEKVTKRRRLSGWGMDEETVCLNTLYRSYKLKRILMK